MNARLVYRSDPRRSIKALMMARLAYQNARSVPWAGDIGPRTSKSSSPPEELDSRILRGYCGAKEFGNPGPFHIKPKAHAENEEMSENE